MNKFEEALNRILETNRLDVAKEIAADVLDIDVEEYLYQDNNNEDDLDYDEDQLDFLDFESDLV